MVGQEPRCPKCGKSKKQSKYGSITQWMTSCNCDLIEQKTEPESREIATCQKCGKRIGSSGRAGSFTQWVFRSDLCSCQISQLRQEQSEIGPVSEKVDGQSEPDVALPRTPEEEIPVDPDFPLGRYKPLKKLGTGASGTVYLCRDRLLRSKVTIKCLRFLNAEQLIAFQQEARALSKLTHSNIIKVLDFGASENGAPYMVMEYFNGRTLQEHIESYGPLDSEVSMKVFGTVCDALTRAHNLGVFHRDIKSSNILIAEQNVGVPNVKLIDFGVALVKHAHQEPTIVQGITVVGTPAYMPPDQALGKPFDARSEVYSVGCTLFESLVGEVPFRASSPMELIRMHSQDVPPSLREVNPDIEFSPQVEALVAKCLEKDPDERFQTLIELRDACEAAVGQGYTGTWQVGQQDASQASYGGTSQGSYGGASQASYGRTSQGSGYRSGKTSSLPIGLILVVVTVATGFFVLDKLSLLRPRHSAELVEPAERLFSSPGLQSQLVSVKPNPSFAVDDRKCSLAVDYGEELEKLPAKYWTSLSIKGGTFSPGSLCKFIDRHEGMLATVEIKSCDRLLNIISDICKSKKTQLNFLELNTDKALWETEFDELYHQPLDSLKISDVQFSEKSLERLFEVLSKSHIKSLSLGQFTPYITQKACDRLGACDTLESLSINNSLLPEYFYKKLSKLNRLSSITLTVPIESGAAYFLAESQSLRRLTVWGDVVSTKSLDSILSKRKIQFLGLGNLGSFLIEFLECAKKGEVSELLIIGDEPSQAVLNLLAEMKHLRSLELITEPSADIATLKSRLPQCKYIRARSLTEVAFPGSGE